MSSLPDSITTDLLTREVLRRRTFAIISHPDAGKTTLTEKLLLYAGAVKLAGTVRARKRQRYATSDWMEIEQARGISITSTVLQFDHRGTLFNLLDTPGHQDFSEDTYRTLLAVDSAVMVLDAAKGIEPQTQKLFEVCRMRGLPIVTFINKLDQPGRPPLDLLDEIEAVLELHAVPFNWPVGEGAAFQGVYDLRRRQVLRFQRTAHGQQPAPVEIGSVRDPLLTRMLGEEATARLLEEIDLLTTAGTAFEAARFRSGEITPVFFGSALTNFGVEPFLSALQDLAPPPSPRLSDRGPVLPSRDVFSGFIFKLQANMDLNHRDCMAFLRVCSGRFQKDMVVHHGRLGRTVRITRPHRLFGRERETIATAYPGDVIGLANPGLFTIGDTLSADEPRKFEAIPRFSPECFGLLENQDTAKHKQFHKGLQQLESEGVLQVFWAADSLRRQPIIGAVGRLQFDVAVARLADEYGVKASVRVLPFVCARRIDGAPEAIARAQWPYSGWMRALDHEGRLLALFESQRVAERFLENNPDLTVRVV